MQPNDKSTQINRYHPNKEWDAYPRLIYGLKTPRLAEFYYRSADQTQLLPAPHRNQFNSPSISLQQKRSH
jgi:hypothetical protein